MRTPDRRAAQQLQQALEQVGLGDNADRSGPLHDRQAADLLVAAMMRASSSGVFSDTVMTSRVITFSTLSFGPVKSGILHGQRGGWGGEA